MREISGVIIARNAEEQIADCIKALARVCSEIVVVVTDSVDQTETIAKKLGAQVHTHQWLGFGRTKNLGADLAQFDWILSIDTDEVLSEELINSIQSVSLTENTVYQLDRISSLCGQWIHHSGWYPDWVFRLYHRKYVQWNDAHVHESLTIPSDFKTEKLSGKLFHYSYTSLEQFDQKMDRYARLSARSMYESGKRHSILLATLSPVFRYFRTFILKMGFLDGRYGLWLSSKNAELVRRKYRYFKEMLDGSYLES